MKPFVLLILIVISPIVASLKSQADEISKKILLGHTGRVFALTFSHDGNWLASGGSGDNEIRVQSVSSEGEIHTLVGHEGKINALAFRKNGELISGSDDGTVRLWNIPESRQIHQFNGGGGQITSLSVSPDDRLLVTGKSDDTLKLWEIDTAQLLRTLEGHEDLVWAVTFSPDGTTIASGSEDRTVRLWNVTDGALTDTLVGHTDRIWSVAFHPDGTQLASGSWDGTVRTWETATNIPFPDQPVQRPKPAQIPEDTNNLKTTAPFARYEREVLSVAYSPDGRLLAIGLADAPNDETVRLWDTLTRRELRAFDKKSRHDLAFSPDGIRLATTGASDGGIIMWESTPLTPRPLAPQPNTQIQTPTILFQWEAIPSAIYYDLQIARDPQFVQTPTSFITQTETQHRFQIEEGVKKYWWRVRTGGFGNVSEWSTGGVLTTLYQDATACALKILPPRRWISDGEEFIVEIIIEDVTDLAGFQFNLHWTNPEVLSFVTVTEFKTIFNADEPNPPRLPNQDDRFFQIDQENGTFSNVVATRFGEGGISGSGTLLKVLFKTEAIGTSAIELQQLRLADSELQAIHCDIHSATIIVEQEARPWDINRDRVVDIFDLRIVANYFDTKITTDIGINPDINGDGVVDSLDITLVSSHFGETYE
jgi:WD40 repeat protein